MTSDPQHHVFFDPTGRRRRRLKALMIIAAAPEAVRLGGEDPAVWRELDAISAPDR